MASFGSFNQSPGQWFGIGKEVDRAPFLGGIAAGQAKQAQRAQTQKSFGQILGSVLGFVQHKQQMDMLGNVNPQQQQIQAQQGQQMAQVGQGSGGLTGSPYVGVQGMGAAEADFGSVTPEKPTVFNQGYQGFGSGAFG